MLHILYLTFLILIFFNFDDLHFTLLRLDKSTWLFADYAHIIHHLIDDILYHAVLRHRGSVSAEHGIGQEKKAALTMARSSTELALMRAVKASLDPKQILNPGKMF